MEEAAQPSRGGQECRCRAARQPPPPGGPGRGAAGTGGRSRRDPPHRLTSPRSPAPRHTAAGPRATPAPQGVQPPEKPPPGPRGEGGGRRGGRQRPRSPPRPAARAPPQETPPWPRGARPPPPCLPTPRPRPRPAPAPGSAPLLFPSSDWRAGPRPHPPGCLRRLPIGSRSMPRLETRAARAA